VFFFFSSRRRHTRFSRDWSSDVCSSDLPQPDAPSFTANFLQNWGRLVEASPREITSFLSIFPARPGQPMAQAITVFAGDDVEARSEERRVGKECRSRWWR